ncbi:MAG: dipeptidyl peptidase 3 [Bacteroidales bacterium]|nr:dipeptidyl peptidase 3 [Bacteroidales bacterium]MCF8396662.1 dipeptidyl peptidase 3 [Bacteroidales bacterium]
MKKFILMTMIAMFGLMACSSGEGKKEEDKKDEFKYKIDQFADLRVMRYRIPGWEELSLKQKKLIYYLSEAAKAGRDIVFDQNFQYNLAIRETLEEIYKNYQGDRNTEDFKDFMVYLKRIWFSNGIHHHYSTDKIMPDFSEGYFMELARNSKDAEFPVKEDQSTEEFLEWIKAYIFDPEIAAKKIVTDPDKDIVAESATNFYAEDVNQKEVLKFYKKVKDPEDDTPVSYGLNTKIVKENGKIKEEVYKFGSLYGPAIEKIVYWLEKAKKVAENEQQKKGFEALIDYYKTGDLETWDEYNVRWLNDGNAFVDYVNGFIEVYGDPLGMKATWESVVDFKNMEATKRTKIISENAQWFEDNSPVDPRFKKKEVKGVTAKVIKVAQLGGDCYPTTPIGINLPNADWIRKEHGSKSVTMDNITYAYDQVAMQSGFLEEFAASQEEIDRQHKYGSLSDNIHTDMHECIGHASGQLLPGTSSEALQSYSSALEESRADLFALYYMMDPKMVELGLLPELEAAKAQYDGYIRNGLMTQLTRIELGKDIEQAHMRNRQLISKWCYEKGKNDNVIEMFKKDGKTYVMINDYEKLRELLGELLAEVQRIKSEGDYEAGKELVESYGVKVDPALHAEVKERYAKLNLAPYGGFINPDIIPVRENGEIVDVKVEYPDDYVEQMMEYSTDYSFLPVYN